VLARGGGRVTDLVARFGVSDMTVRRDLDALARDGVLEKVHGGAVALGASRAHEPGFEAKQPLESAAKEAIAAAAARLVRPGGAVAFSAGTTTFAVARHLAGFADLTVVTNSMRIADALTAHGPGGGRGSGGGGEQGVPGLGGPGTGDPAASAGGRGGPTVVLTGGVRTPSDALVGPVADQAIRSLNFDLVFVGCHGICPAAGLTTPNLAEAETNRALLRSARRIVALADHSKWGVAGLAAFAPLSEVDTWITDAGLPQAAREEAAEYVRELIIA
jgi:DeoR/GlpR family transcriptional regulator of sugar metabolism